MDSPDSASRPRAASGSEDPFTGRVALVTGAGDGIGRATALALAAQGAHVVATDIDAEAAARTAADVKGTSHPLDVRDRDAMLALAATIEAEHGPLDILVNNAGVGMAASFLDTSADDWDWIIGINLRGVINGCQAFGPAMVERGRGHVVNVASMMGYVPSAGQVAYVTTKAAVLEMTRSLRADWGRNGVGVTALCPGLIRTGIIERTRFRGKRFDDETVAEAHRFFEKGKPPSVAAKAIVDAIRHNRAVVTVGVEARLTWWMRGLLPASAVNAIARGGNDDKAADAADVV